MGRTNALLVYGFMTWSVLGVLASDARAQAPTSPRSVSVDGMPMRAWTSGLEGRKTGQPVLVLEAGAGEGLENWRTALDSLGSLAPVVAYDRRGVGGSAADSERPSLRRVAQSLHALLRQLGVAPPYVLVGHSWGGLFVRAFADQYRRKSQVWSCSRSLTSSPPQKKRQPSYHRPTVRRSGPLRRCRRFRLARHRGCAQSMKWSRAK